MLIIDASRADASVLTDVVFRWRNLVLLGKTLGLTVSVLIVVTLLALPLAWLTTRSNLYAARFWTILCVMPLAIPGYLMAFTLLSFGGRFGMLNTLFGIHIPRIQGYWGALIALSMYLLPYMFLNLRVGFQRMDPALEEAGRSLGCSRSHVFFRITLPQLKPAFAAGALLVTLHVIGDLGVVSLMRFDTFTYSIYQEYMGFDALSKTYAACLSLMLIAMTIGLLILDLYFLRGLRIDSVRNAPIRKCPPTRHKGWFFASFALLLIIVLVGLILPVLNIAHWTWRWEADIPDQTVFTEVFSSLASSLKASIPAALFAVILATPIAFLAMRYPSKLTRSCQQSAYVGYAIPAVAFGYSLIVLFSQHVNALYQTIYLLIFAYVIHFLAEALGPIRSSLFLATKRLEDASRSLGRSRFSTFIHVTLPLLRPGLIVGMAFVFLSAMKELPLTLLLSPIGYETLAWQVWSYADNTSYAKAAPHALAILVFSAGFVWLLLMRGPEKSR